MSAQPPYPDLMPTVEWQVAGHCNYDCSYCIQSRKTRVGQPDEGVLRNIVASFARLPGTWEIKISGGEPFAARLFMDLAIPLLAAETPHQISVLTNFSAPLKSLERFAILTGDRLRITSASLHLETISPSSPSSPSSPNSPNSPVTANDLDAFIEKAIAYRELRARYNPHSSFVINSVLVPNTLRRLFLVRDRVEAAGFRWFPQLMKLKGGVHPYDADERKLVEVLTRASHDPHVVNRAPSYRGLHCEAGAWYFVVDQRGEAHACRTSKRFSAHGLGNLADGTFSLAANGGPCPFDICPCTVPPNRGIVRLAGPRPPDLDAPPDSPPDSPPDVQRHGHAHG